MKPILGWVVLSDTDRAAAERRLGASTAGDTRDELGFGAIHFAYADRFFPGTSVLQTRVRYAWFICWAYQELMHSKQPGRLAQAVRALEVRTAHKLLKEIKKPSGSGVIGWTRFVKRAEPVTMPSQIYWNALRLWGVLRPREQTGKAPGQAELHARWFDWQSPQKRKDELAHENGEPIFSDLPPIPEKWSDANSTLDFKLSKAESNLIKSCWKKISLLNWPGEPLMSKLANLDQLPSGMWSQAVLKTASTQDCAALKRARQAASLVCIGRALYAAMVENLKNNDSINSHQSDLHNSWLEELRLKHRDRALALNLREMSELDVKVSEELLKLLEAVQAWTDKGGSFEKLEPAFTSREVNLKGSRAMLLPSSSARRAAWNINRPAEPLNYRWPVVRQFLEDLSV